MTTDLRIEEKPIPAAEDDSDGSSDTIQMDKRTILQNLQIIEARVSSTWLK